MTMSIEQRGIGKRLNQLRGILRRIESGELTGRNSDATSRAIDYHESWLRERVEEMTPAQRERFERMAPTSPPADPEPSSTDAGYEESILDARVAAQEPSDVHAPDSPTYPSVVLDYAAKRGYSGVPVIAATFRAGHGWTQSADEPRYGQALDMTMISTLKGDGVEAVSVHWPSHPEMDVDFQVYELASRVGLCASGIDAPRTLPAKRVVSSS